MVSNNANNFKDVSTFENEITMVVPKIKLAFKSIKFIIFFFIIMKLVFHSEALFFIEKLQYQIRERSWPNHKH